MWPVEQISSDIFCYVISAEIEGQIPWINPDIFLQFQYLIQEKKCKKVKFYKKKSLHGINLDHVNIPMALMQFFQSCTYHLHVRIL